MQMVYKLKDSFAGYYGVRCKIKCAKGTLPEFLIAVGERCISCLLQHISPNISDICVGDPFNITITTNQSHPHGSVFTLLINDGVCHSGGGGDGMVSCREQGGDVLQATFSYYITARNAGIATITAHTTYYGAEWYSTSKVVTIRECDDDTPEGNTTNGTLVTIVTPTNMSDGPSTMSNGTGSGDSDNTTLLPATTPPNVPINTKDESSWKVAITTIIIVLVLFVLILALVAFLTGLLLRRKRKKKCHPIAPDSPELPEVEPHLPLQAVQVPSDGTSLPMEEFTTVQLGGPVDVIPHPRNQVMGLVMDDSPTSTLTS
ncbi:uncharacterized protein [Dysidea avara]|uniref:uncharacterized protein isoform X2 n=1 Tax=Dysidea avara TaxID=196820 RepID=UPI003330EE6E